MPYNTWKLSNQFWIFCKFQHDHTKRVRCALNLQSPMTILMVLLRLALSIVLRCVDLLQFRPGIVAISLHRLAFIDCGFFSNKAEPDSQGLCQLLRINLPVRCRILRWYTDSNISYAIICGLFLGILYHKLDFFSRNISEKCRLLAQV